MENNLEVDCNNRSNVDTTDNIEDNYNNNIYRGTIAFTQRRFLHSSLLPFLHLHVPICHSFSGN